MHTLSLSLSTESASYADTKINIRRQNDIFAQPAKRNNNNNNIFFIKFVWVQTHLFNQTTIRRRRLRWRWYYYFIDINRSLAFLCSPILLFFVSSVTFCCWKHTHAQFQECNENKLYRFVFDSILFYFFDRFFSSVLFYNIIVLGFFIWKERKGESSGLLFNGTLTLGRSNTLWWCTWCTHSSSNHTIATLISF